MAEINNIPIDETRRRFPFLRHIQDKRPDIPLKISLSELDDEFLNQSLLEEESEAAGHFNVRKDLYVVRGDKLFSVEVRRLTRRIYPPVYLHYDSDFPSDDPGCSETVRGALSRQDLTKAQYVVLYTRGDDRQTEEVNNILIVLIKK